MFYVSTISRLNIKPSVAGKVEAQFYPEVRDGINLKKDGMVQLHARLPDEEGLLAEHYLGAGDYDGKDQVPFAAGSAKLDVRLSEQPALGHHP